MSSGNVAEVGEQVLGYFWDLAVLYQRKRLAAAEGLSAHLRSDSSQQVTPAAPATSESQGDLQGCPAPVAYVLRRLLRGLESNRQAARQGFALALTVVLQDHPQIPTPATLDILESVLETSNTAKGSDTRNYLLGRIFGYAAFARAGRLQQTPDAARCTEALTVIMHQKSYLREVAARVILLMLTNLSADQLEQVLSSSTGLQELLQAPIAASSPEAAWLALSLWPRLPTSIVQSCPLLPSDVTAPTAGYLTGSMQHSKDTQPATAAFFSHAHISSILPLILETSNSRPRLHSLWITLLHLLVPGYSNGDLSSTARPRPGAQLGVLWNVAVEGQLFMSPSLERRALGLQLFSILVPYLQPEQIPTVFSPSCLRCLTSSLSRDDSQLKALAQKCIKGLTASLDQAPDKGLRVAAVVALQRHGGVGFDRLAGTQLCARLLQGLDAEGIAHYLNQLPYSFAQPQLIHSDLQQTVEDQTEGGEHNAEAAVHAGRVWIIEQMTAAARLPKCSQQSISQAADFLAVQAFCTATDGMADTPASKVAAACDPPLSSATRQLSAARLLTLLGSVLKPTSRKRKAPAAADGKAEAVESAAAPAKKRKKDKAGKAAATVSVETADGEADSTAGLNAGSILQGVLAVLHGAANAKQQGLMMIEAIPEEVISAAASLQKTADKLGRAASGASSSSLPQQGQAFARLCHLLHLYFLADPENADTDLPADLEGIATDACLAPAGSALKEGSTPWMDRLMDVLLSLLAKGAGEQLPFAPLREAIEALFKLCCPALTSTGMQDMLRVIAQPLDASQQQQEQGAESSDDDADILQQDDDSADEAFDSALSSSEDEDVEEEGPQLNDALGHVAQNETQAHATDSDGDEDMTDAQMFSMDAALSAALKSATEGKSKASRKATREALLDFKFRVLSLLECFVRRMPGSPLIPAAIPLLLRACRDLMRPDGSQQLASSLAKFIDSRIARAKLDKGSAFEAPVPEDLQQLFSSVRRLLGRERDQQLAAVASSAFLYLLRVAAAAGKASEEHQAAAREACQDVLKDVFQSRSSHVPVSLLEEAARRCPACMLPHSAAVAELCTAARSEFLRQQALQLMLVLLKLPKEGWQETPQALSSSAVTKALCGAVHGAFAKPDRHVAALKLVHSCWQAAQGKEHLPTVNSPDMAQAIGNATAAHYASPNAKVFAQLQRLSELSGSPLPVEGTMERQTAAIIHLGPASQKADKAKIKEAQQKQPSQQVSQDSALPASSRPAAAATSRKQHATQRQHKDAIKPAAVSVDSGKAAKEKGVRKVKGGPLVRKGEQARKAALQAKARAAMTG